MDKFNDNPQEYLKDIIMNTLTSDDLDAAIKNISMELGKLFNADRVHFRSYDKIFKTFSEVIEEYRKNETIPSAKGRMIYPEEFDIYLNDKLQIEEPLFIIDDINKPEFPESFRELFKSLDIKNEIILPIFYKNELESAFFITNTESTELLSSKNLGFLIPIAKYISTGTHLFKLNEALNKKAYQEKVLRETIFKVRLFDDPNEVFEYMANSLAEMHKVNRVAHLHVSSSEEYTVVYEALRNGDPKLKGKVILRSENLKSLEAFLDNSVIMVNDIEQIEDNEFRNSLNQNDIKAFILYPIEDDYFSKGHMKIKEKIMLCSKIPKKWSNEDVQSLKLLIGAITLVYVDIRKRKDLKETEESFVAALIHDLKSPIYAEQKALEYMMSRKPDTCIQNILPYLKDMHETNEEMLRLITNLLTVYSMDFGELNLKKEPTSISKITDEAIRSIKPLFDDNKSNLLIKNIEDNMVDIYMDPDEIKRVFTNLLSNAIKHNKQGVEISISSEIKDNEIILAISDNGVGMEESEKANIFERFTTRKRGIGTGLGLYLSKQIIENHGGKMWFESEKDKGTTFYFSLPLTKSI